MGCEPYVAGNGVFLEENRTASVGAFEGIRIESGVEATVTANVPEGSRSVIVSGDSNVVPWIETRVDADAVLGYPVLRVSIKLSGGYDATVPPRVVVSVPKLRSVSASGTRSDGTASKVSVQGATDVAAVEGADASSIGLALPAVTLRATPPTLAVKLSGSSLLDARSYAVDPPDNTAGAVVTLAGGSRALLRVDGAVKGEASGGSVVDNRSGSLAGTCEVVLTGAAVCCAGGGLTCP